MPYSVSDDKAETIAELLRSKRLPVKWDWISGGRINSDLDRKRSNQFLLVSILNYQMHPSAVVEKVKDFVRYLGNPDSLWEEILKLDAQEAIKSHRLHRFPKGHERVWRIGQMVVDHYGGDASRIWSLGTDSAEVKRRLSQMRVGEQISNMIVGALYDTGWIEGGGDVKADRHVARLGGHPKPANEGQLKTGQRN